MSKLNIEFNGASFVIDESALESASADIKSHLSSVMNGAGATINFGGVDYNVDSTKLSAATNNFITHLGTIAGNGAKITIGGVEYNVDADKLEEVTAEFEYTLSAMIPATSAIVTVGNFTNEIIDCTYTAYNRNNEIEEVQTNAYLGEYTHFHDVVFGSEFALHTSRPCTVTPESVNIRVDEANQVTYFTIPDGVSDLIIEVHN